MLAEFCYGTEVAYATVEQQQNGNQDNYSDNEAPPGRQKQTQTAERWPTIWNTVRYVYMCVWREK